MLKIPSKLAGQQSGFTLIELVIVIVIIGILAAVAIPNFSSMTDDAKSGKNQAILGAVKSSYSVAVAKAKGSAISSYTDITGLMTDPSCGTGNTADPTSSGHTIVCGTAGILFAQTANITSSSGISCTNCP
jgi:MSHA pilin protein MshA